MSQSPSISSASSASSASPALPTSPEMRLHGRWLALARVACLGIVLVALAIWVWGVPLRYVQLGTLCTVALANCGDQQVTPALFQRFQAAGVPLSFYGAYFGAVEVLYALVYLVMGALLFWRKSDTRIGLLTAVLLITYGVGQTDGSAVAAAVPALAAPSNLLNPLSFICLAVFLYLFPDGRFSPRWTRWLVFAWIPLFLVVAAVSYDAVVPVLFGLLFLSLGVQIYRYRHVSSLAQRQQTKWVLFGVLVGLLGSGSIIVAGLIFNLSQMLDLWGIFVANTLIYVFSACIPLSIGWAILRSRLWDIDTLINKALVYGSLTVLLGTLYVGFIIGLEGLAGLFVTQASDPIVLVVSTLAIAALFQPSRRRIQSIIDRRFYRKKYDAVKTLAAFSATLRTEVDLEQMGEPLLAVVRETMQPAHVSLWLRQPDRHPSNMTHRMEPLGEASPRPSSD